MDSNGPEESTEMGRTTLSFAPDRQSLGASTVKESNDKTVYSGIPLESNECSGFEHMTDVSKSVPGLHTNRFVVVSDCFR